MAVGDDFRLNLRRGVVMARRLSEGSLQLREPSDERAALVRKTAHRAYVGPRPFTYVRHQPIILVGSNDGIKNLGFVRGPINDSKRTPSPPHFKVPRNRRKPPRARRFRSSMCPNVCVPGKAWVSGLADSAKKTGDRHGSPGLTSRLAGPAPLPPPAPRIMRFESPPAERRVHVGLMVLPLWAPRA